MELFNSIKQFLAKPFPQEESFQVSLKIMAFICVFVVFFLYVFKPFGIHTLESKQFLICLGFGVVSFIASVLYELVIVFVLKVKGIGVSFTYGRWIVYIVGVMIFISLANFLFIRISFFGHVDWSLFQYMLRGTLAIGVFPIVAMGAFALMQQEKKYQGIAAHINQKGSNREKSEQASNTQGGKLFDIATEQIRYVEAMQNYLKIGYLDAQGKLHEKIERATLKSVLDQDLGEALVRCHRSYLVNMDSIISTSGNAQGLILSLADCDRSIPVSRSFIPNFR